LLIRLVVHRPVVATVSVDPNPWTEAAVKVLVVLASAALGFGAGFVVRDFQAVRAESPEAISHAEARDLAERLESRMLEGDSCAQALTLVGPQLLRDATDAWGNRYKVRCYGELGVVQSPGPDRRWRTRDDVIALTDDAASRPL
jgi:hypothetical protein